MTNLTQWSVSCLSDSRSDHCLLGESANMHDATFLTRRTAGYLHFFVKKRGYGPNLSKAIWVHGAGYLTVLQSGAISIAANIYA